MSSPQSCKFLKTHEWVSFDGAHATVGISDHAQKEITDVVFVELPKVGQRVAQGEAVAVVESVKAAFDIYSPVSGEVIAVNEELAANPSLVNSSPHGNGWFFRLKASESAEAESLMGHGAYQEFLQTSSHG